MYSLNHSIVITNNKDESLTIENDPDYSQWITVTSSLNTVKDPVLYLELEQARLLSKALNLICDNMEKDEI